MNKDKSSSLIKLSHVSSMTLSKKFIKIVSMSDGKLKTPLKALDQDNLRQRLISHKLNTMDEPDCRFKAYMQDSFDSDRSIPVINKIVSVSNLDARAILKVSRSMGKVDTGLKLNDGIKVTILKDHYPVHITVAPNQYSLLKISAANKQFPLKFKFFDSKELKMRVYWSYNRWPTTTVHDGYLFMEQCFVINGMPDVSHVCFKLVLEDGIYQHYVGCSFASDKPALLRDQHRSVVYGIDERYERRITDTSESEYTMNRPVFMEMSQISLQTPKKIQAKVSISDSVRHDINNTLIASNYSAFKTFSTRQFSTIHDRRIQIAAVNKQHRLDAKISGMTTMVERNQALKIQVAI